MTDALGRLGVALAGIVAATGLLGACGAPRFSIPVHQVVVVPARGQGEAQSAQDRYECYRLAQPGGFEGHGASGHEVAAGAATGALSGAALGALAHAGRGAAAGGVIGGMFGAIIAAEMADARARPADLDRYAECLRGRDYEVRRPQ